MGNGMFRDVGGCPTPVVSTGFVGSFESVISTHAAEYHGRSHLERRRRRELAHETLGLVDDGTMTDDLVIIGVCGGTARVLYTGTSPATATVLTTVVDGTSTDWLCTLTLGQQQAYDLDRMPLRG